MRIRIKIKRSRAVTALQRPNNWVAVGTLAAYSTAGAGSVAVVTAQTQASQSKQPTEPVLLVIKFQIPSGALGEVIAEFEKATGWKVEFPEPGMRLIPSNGVAGALPAGQGLKQLLEGTKLTYRMAGPSRARLAVAEVQTSVDVTERAPITSPRYTEPLRDIPQTITVIPKTVIEQQGATSLTEVLRNVPGLTITAGEGGVPSGDNLTMRGNSARNDIFVDGVRDLNPQSRDPFNLEQVEVTKGPTSAVSGRGSGGGTINLVSKNPNLARVLGGSLALGNASTRRGSLDLNTPLQSLGMGERTALRLNLLVHDAGVAGRDVVNNSRWGVAPSLAFGLGTPTRLTVGYYKLKQDNISDYGIPWVPATNNALAQYRDQPAPVPRSTFYGFKDRDREVLNQDTGTVRVEHDFTDSLQIRNQFRFGKSGRNSVATPPRFAGNDSTAINREMRSWVAVDKIWDNQTDVNAKATTFGIRHSLVMGGEFLKEDNTRINRTAPGSPTTLLNPNPDDIYTGAVTVSPFVGKINANTQAGWIFDTAKFGQHFEANGGMRLERFSASGVTTVPAPVAQTVTMANVRAALIYKPVQSGSIYTSYGSSTSPSLEGLSYNTSNTLIPPEKTYTTEVGTKWDFFRDRLLVTGALFRVAKDNARTPGLIPTDPPQVLAGRQVSQGIELSASGSITRNLRVLGAYTLIDARIRSSNTPAEVGRYFQNTPRNSASVWLTYTAKRFSAGVGPRAVGKRFGNNINTRKVDAYGTVDGMVSYRVSNHLDLRLNLSNLGDTYYYERLGGGHLVPGPSRYVLFTTNFHF
jgi:catecholate siderophore receptor